MSTSTTTDWRQRAMDALEESEAAERARDRRLAEAWLKALMNRLENILGPGTYSIADFGTDNLHADLGDGFYAYPYGNESLRLVYRCCPLGEKEVDCVESIISTLVGMGKFLRRVEEYKRPFSATA